MAWQYTVGLSTREISEEALKKRFFKYKKIKIEDEIRKFIPEVIDAVYKNPSSMREDAPRAFSCSSLISYLFTKGGVWMPSLSVDKYIYGTPIKKEELKFGDLIFSNTGEGRIYFETIEWQPGTKVLEGVDHVGMYLGNNKVIHATKKFGKVIIQTIEEFEKLSKIVGFRRIADRNEERFLVEIPDDMSDIKTAKDLIDIL